MFGCSAVTATTFCVQAGETTKVNLVVPQALVSGGEVVMKKQKQADPWCLVEVGSTELYSFEVKSDELYGMSSRVRTDPIGFEDSQKRSNVAHVQLKAGVRMEVNLKVPRALLSHGEVGSTELYSFEVKSDELYGNSSRVRADPIGFEDSQKRANVAHVQLPFLPSSELYRLL